MGKRNTLGAELKRMQSFEYKTVDVSTLEGLKEADRLKASGWAMYSVGVFQVKFYRERRVKS